jgi:hypothetical protein
MELNGTRRHAWPQFQIQINTWTDRPSPINAGTRRNSLVSKTANGTGINPAVRLKGHSARLPSGLLISPPSRQGFRPSPAAISSSLLLIPGLRGRGSRGAEPSTFCAPFAWLERKPHSAYNRERRSPNVPSSPGNAKAPVENSLLPGPSSAVRMFGADDGPTGAGAGSDFPAGSFLRWPSVGP